MTTLMTSPPPMPREQRSGRYSPDDLLVMPDGELFELVDGELVEKLVSTHDFVVTLEDHQLLNGFGSAVLEEANLRGLDTRKITRLGIPDQFIPHGSRPWQLKQCGLDADGIVETVARLTRANKTSAVHG